MAISFDMKTPLVANGTFIKRIDSHQNMIKSFKFSSRNNKTMPITSVWPLCG